MSESLPDFLEQRRAGFVHDLGYKPGSNFRTWRNVARRAYQDAVEGYDATASAKLDRTEPRSQGGERHFYTLTFAHGARAEAVCLVPENPTGAPLPTILLLHDHGGGFTCGWDKMLDPSGTNRMRNAGESTAWVYRYYGGRPMGDFLCNQGFVVLCADALGWGDRASPEGYEGQQRLAANAMQLGLNPAGIVAAEDAQTLRWLSDQSFVDSKNIAAAGFSFGGYRAWQVAALCDQVAATISLGWMARRTGMMAPGTGMLRGQSAFYMLHPSLAGRLDFPDMAGVAAGCPTFMRVGDTDPVFPAPAARGAFKDLTRIWTAADAAHNLDVDLFCGAHICPAHIQAKAVEFLNRQFNRSGV